MSSIGKQFVCQKYIYKIHSARLRRAKWDLVLPLPEARRNDEVISMADSQVLRWIDQLNGAEDADSRARRIRAEIERARRGGNTVANRRLVKSLYAQLDEVQFKKDYMCLVIDREKDYRRACRGFRINGVRYVRLVGTNGGVKNKTIVFVSERLAPELRRRIDNGRDMTKELVPAKLEAYRALACSASIPVSIPRGILVVSDCETSFRADVIYVDDSGSDEPVMEERRGVEVALTESDGYGLMLPSLAERWSRELGLGYRTAGVNTRFSWEKGMVFAFDFLDFADKVAGSYLVKDAWGAVRDIREAELILTTSMLKLWDSYGSLEEYLDNCARNGYAFAVTKCCPASLENERSLNYQFIQSYCLSDADIERLIGPTLEELRGVLYADTAKTALFLKGAGLNEDNIGRTEDDFAKALMIEPSMIRDPYVQNQIYQAIRGRINEAKIGVLKVRGNYSIVCGDPYALCQHIFGLDVTGLLHAGEVYNKYWLDAGAERLACFRAPMTAHENIRLVRPNGSEQARYWYRYMDTCTLFNAWDTAAHALNGCDKTFVACIGDGAVKTR